MKIKELRMVQTIEGMEELIPGAMYDIGYRGGYFGYSSEKISVALGIKEGLLPPKVGVFCNYMGGGIRGALGTSSYSPEIKGRQKKLLDEFLAACKRVYISAEDDQGLNQDYEDGINWDAMATRATRAAGQVYYPGLEPRRR
jgi:hypothetical protein